MKRVFFALAMLPGAAAAESQIEAFSDMTSGMTCNVARQLLDARSAARVELQALAYGMLAGAAANHNNPNLPFEAKMAGLYAIAQVECALQPSALFIDILNRTAE